MNFKIKAHSFVHRISLVFFTAGLFSCGSSGNTQESGIVQAMEPTRETTSKSLNPQGYSPEEVTNITVYEKVNTSVVNITTDEITYNWFLEPVPQKGTSAGSGSVIDERGYILTNRHVVANAYKVYVTLHDGTQFEGDVVGTDDENDLSVIKIEPKGHPLNAISFGDSVTLKVGQKVLAIGNPFGFERTLTIGIVSGLGRPIRNENSLIIRDMIQTDASINPGNSGGPLLDTSGRMIGINTSIYSPSGGSVGVGFAVPVDTAKRVVPDLIEYGRVQRGWIEIEPVQLFPQLVRYADLPVSKGILVSSVKKSGNADKAGIKGGNRSRAVRTGRNVIYLEGDIIIEIDGQKIETFADFYGALEDTKPGDTSTVVVVRGSREETFTMPLAERPQNK